MLELTDACKLGDSLVGTEVGMLGELSLPSQYEAKCGVVFDKLYNDSMIYTFSRNDLVVNNSNNNH